MAMIWVSLIAPNPEGEFIGRWDGIADTLVSVGARYESHRITRSVAQTPPRMMLPVANCL